MTLLETNLQFDILLKPNDPVQRKLRRDIGLSGKKAAWYRWQVKQGKLSTDVKLSWLRKAGIDVAAQQFSRIDMLDFLRFSQRKDSQRSLEHLGEEYLFEKYLLWVQQGRPAVVLVAG